MYIITDIQVQKRNKNRLNLFINETFYKSTTPYIVKKFGLEKGKSVDVETLDAAILEESLEKAKSYVVDYHLNKPKKIIQDKLKQKGYEEEVIDSVIKFLDTYKLVDDKQYAKSFTNDSVFIKKHGRNRIKQSLKQKGVSDSDIEEALRNISDDEELEMAIRSLNKKVNTYRRKAKNFYDLRSKCYVFLIQRGFTSDISTNATNQVLSEDEEF